ncbi:hypothetical protein [Candidatus Nitrotoga sp. M5]|uniref:hypothetical protein n=1 Tax=Candidatus Nitrotoga sp. M5 TaxID=2890409 RepID=UPI001EF16BB0|nr:hypothetical protein [Candidatus Nitrotoga sp. M5]CAH1386175.1 hypothetical protein NTGM5_220020 [Candidatus Nitrotoga sp. M5]
MSNEQALVSDAFGGLLLRSTRQLLKRGEYIVIDDFILLCYSVIDATPFMTGEMRVYCVM